MIRIQLSTAEPGTGQDWVAAEVWQANGKWWMRHVGAQHGKPFETPRRGPFRSRREAESEAWQIYALVTAKMHGAEFARMMEVLDTNEDWRRLGQIIEGWGWDYDGLWPMRLAQLIDFIATRPPRLRAKLVEIADRMVNEMLGTQHGVDDTFFAVPIGGGYTGYVVSQGGAWRAYIVFGDWRPWCDGYRHVVWRSKVAYSDEQAAEQAVLDAARALAGSAAGWRALAG